jgi:hypothetical protein
MKNQSGRYVHLQHKLIDFGIKSLSHSHDCEMNRIKTVQKHQHWKLNRDLKMEFSFIQQIEVICKQCRSMKSVDARNEKRKRC